MLPVNNPKKILIVEDVDDISCLLKVLFVEEGYQVICLPNGREALDYLQSTANLPTVILLDLSMPIMDGFAFREAQQGDARLAKIPIILMTAAGDSLNKAQEIGANVILKKPFPSIDSVLQAVNGFFTAPQAQ